MTCPEAAEALSTCRTYLWRAEAGLVPLRRAPPRNHRVTLPLLLRLARRRSGLGLRGAAARMGVSHQTLLNWEAAGEEVLVEWWRRRGFTFP